MYWDSPPARALRAAGIPVYRAVESAVAGLDVLAADAVRHPRPIPSLPPAASRLSPGPATTEARAALAAAGVPFGAARTVHDRSAALAAAAELGYPVVLKALGALHKSDAGGVVLGLRDAQRARRGGRAPRRRRVLGRGGRGHGGGPRAARRRPPRPALRPDRRRRRRRHLHGALPRHGGRARAGRRTRRRGAAPLARLRAAARRRARAPAARPAQRPPPRSRRSRASRRHIRRSPRSRSIRCSSARPGPSASTRGSCRGSVGVAELADRRRRRAGRRAPSGSAGAGSTRSASAGRCTCTAVPWAQLAQRAVVHDERVARRRRSRGGSRAARTSRDRRRARSSPARGSRRSRRTARCAHARGG